jgi:hypothetical protein
MSVLDSGVVGVKMKTHTHTHTARGKQRGKHVGGGKVKVGQRIFGQTRGRVFLEGGEDVTAV